jgi:Ca2+-binding EF-hand superfamily protein
MRLLVIALGAACLFVAPVLAQEIDFATVDADGSGLVSVEEIEAAGIELSEEEFAEADADADGYLNEEEFKVAMGQ